MMSGKLPKKQKREGFEKKTIAKVSKGFEMEQECLECGRGSLPEKDASATRQRSCRIISGVCICKKERNTLNGLGRTTENQKSRMETRMHEVRRRLLLLHGIQKKGESLA